MGLLFLCMEHLLQKYCNKKHIVQSNNTIWSWPDKATYTTQMLNNIFFFSEISLSFQKDV